ncbi:MAG: lipoate--protein ligase family protein, partial [Acidimicrobiia bacterium]|nr:lipoate--protein ligase family protein [Acidimicrobiia bacterium]
MPLLPPRRIGLVDHAVDLAGPVDTGLSHATALAVGSGEIGETLRVHETLEIVAFGRQDALTPGYADAIAAAQAVGFSVTERLAGGRAAAFHRGTLAFSWAMPAVDPRAGVHDRFTFVAELMASAFRRLGADAAVGEVEGEYCPGSYSVNIGGRFKVMGVGQRLVRGAAHVGGVVVVRDSARLREVLVPVYSALDLAWSPPTAGALEDAIGPVELSTVRRAILEEISE